jgi:hypothetical protein
VYHPALAGAGLSDTASHGTDAHASLSDKLHGYLMAPESIPESLVNSYLEHLIQEESEELPLLESKLSPEASKVCIIYYHFGG